MGEVISRAQTSAEILYLVILLMGWIWKCLTVTGKSCFALSLHLQEAEKIKGMMWGTELPRYTFLRNSVLGKNCIFVSFFMWGKYFSQIISNSVLMWNESMKFRLQKIIHSYYNMKKQHLVGLKVRTQVYNGIPEGQGHHRWPDKPAMADKNCSAGKLAQGLVFFMLMKFTHNHSWYNC